MIVWLDAQLPPALAAWLANRFGINVAAVRDLGLREAKDGDIFAAARVANAVIVTKDSDFAMLVERNGPPPQIVWITVGNTSNAALRVLLEETWPHAIRLLEAGECLVEISSALRAE